MNKNKFDKFDKWEKSSHRCDVYISYDINIFLTKKSPDKKFEKLCKEVGGICLGGGAGMGMRDLDFSFENQKKAKEFLKNCKAEKIGFKYISGKYFPNKNK